jgi:RecB family exonuclease
MSVVLSANDEGIGGRAAQTGNLIHSAAHAFHTAGPGADPVAAGLAALAVARVQFPEGDEDAAEKTFRRYSSDPENQRAVVPWCEKKVRLTLPASPCDPTGLPIVIQGTLDQVRRGDDGVLRVWDIKTGGRLSADECVEEHIIQQAAYVLAARETLDPSIEAGGLIYTPAYAKNRGRVFLPLPLTISGATILMSAIPALVSAVRRGVLAFIPSVDGCRWCEFRRYPACLDASTGLFGPTRSI